MNIREAINQHSHYSSQFCLWVSSQGQMCVGRAINLNSKLRKEVHEILWPANNSGTTYKTEKQVVLNMFQTDNQTKFFLMIQKFYKAVQTSESFSCDIHSATLSIQQTSCYYIDQIAEQNLMTLYSKTFDELCWLFTLSTITSITSAIFL